MKTFLFVVALVSTLLSHPSMAEKAHHHHKKHESLSLNDGKKWETDKTMKDNMDAIYLQYQAKPQDLAKLSKTITASTNTIVNNCKLDPKADETYHVVLGVLFEVAEELKDIKDIKESEQALKKLKHAFHVYRKYFNHPEPKV